MANSERVKISLENLEQFSVPMESTSAWMFTNDETSALPSEIFRDQIFILNKEASLFLWDYEMGLKINCSPEYFKHISTFDCRRSNEQEMKKYLFNLGVPFDQKIFIAMQPDEGFTLTWKMVIKFSHEILFNSNVMDLVLRDKSHNWQLEYCKGIITFGKDFIFDSEAEVEALHKLQLEKEHQEKVAYHKSKLPDSK